MVFERIICFILFFINPIIFLTFTKDNFIIKEVLLIAIATMYLSQFLLKMIKSHENPFTQKHEYLFLFYLLSILISAFNSKHVFLVFSCFFSQLPLLGVYMLGKYIDKRNLQTIENFLLVGSIIICTYGIAQYLGYDLFTWEVKFDSRPGSTFGNPNFLAGYLVILIPFFIFKLITTKNIIYLIPSILTLTCLYLTKTRGAWIACISSLVFLSGLLIHKRRRIPIACLAIILLILTALCCLYIKSRFDIRDRSVMERIFKWLTAYEMIKDSPVIGIGAGNLKVNFAIYQKLARKNFNIRLKGTSESNVHNEYFQISAEQGLIGILSFIGFFTFPFISFFKKFSLQPEFYKHLSYLASIVGFLVFSLSNFPLRIIPTATVVFFLLGNLNHSRFPQPTKRYHALTVFVWMLYTIVVLRFAIAPFIAEIYRLKGDIYFANRVHQQAIKCYGAAIKLDYYRSERTAYDLGEVYREINKYEDAIKSYQISISLRNYGEVYNNVANCYYLLGDIENALKNWGIALDLGLPNPKDEEIIARNIKILQTTRKIHNRK